MSNFIPYIKINTTKGPLKFLIDTGANQNYISPKHVNIMHCAYGTPHKVRNVSGTHIINRFLKLNPFPFIKDTKPLIFHVFEFHPFFDGLIGYQSLQELKTDILTSTNELKFPSTSIQMYRKYPDTKLVSLNSNETKIITMPSSIEKGDFLLEHDIQIHENVKILSGLYTAEDYNTNVVVCNISPNQVEIKINKPLLTEINNFEQIPPEAPTRNSMSSELFSQLRIDHLNEEEKKKLFKLISQYQSTFHLKSEMLTFGNTIKHRIDTKDDIPVHTKSYRYPYSLKEEVQRQIQDLLRQGIIRPSSSPWSSPIWVVPKKLDATGKRKWRLVVDYRKLNDKTVDDKYPIPNITEVLDKLGRCNYFTTLDLASGFHQIEVNPRDIQKTAFSVDQGKYEFIRMPFGLKNAPSTFQRVMDNVLRDIIGKVCLVYMDDIIVFSTSLQEHIDNLGKVLERLKNYNLKIQLDKSEFLCKEVAFLGHIVTPEGVKPNPDKIDSIKNWPLPKTETELRGFLGTIGYYRRFIRDFAKITKPLTEQLRKGKQITHTDKFIETFNKCKILLTSSHVLQYPDFSKPFILTTDASKFALGAVLSQGPVGQDRPVAFASRTLTKTEESYSVIEKELLAITWGCKYFRPYLYGRKFTLFTDHKPLTYIFSLKDPNDKMIRMRLQLEEYDYDVKYRPGKQNVVADGLSRINTNEINLNEQNDDENSSDAPTCHSADTDDSHFIEMTELPINYFKNQLILKKGQTDSLTYEQVFPNVHRRTIIRTEFTVVRLLDIFKQYMDPKRSNIILCDESIMNILQIVFRNYFSRCKTFKVKISQKVLIDLRTPEEQNDKIEEIHNQAHRGAQENHQEMNRKYYFPGMKRKIQRFVNMCETCLENKYERHPYNIKIHTPEIPNKPFEIIHLDIFISQPYLFLTAVDKFTRFGMLIPIKSRSIPDIRAALVKLLSLYTTPKKVVCDNEPSFRSIEIRSLLQRMGTEIQFTPTDHSQTNGIVERFHSTLSEIFRCIRSKYEEMNKKQIYRIAVGLYNRTIHSAHNHKPFEILFGQREHEEQPLDLEQLFENRQTICEEITSALRRTADKTNTYHNKSREDEPTFTENETAFNTTQGIKSKTRPKFKRITVKQNRFKTIIDHRGRKLHKSKLKRKRK